MPVDNTHRISGAIPIPVGGVSAPTTNPLTMRLLQNPLAANYFKAIPPDAAATYSKRLVEVFQNMPEFIKAKMLEIDRQGTQAILAEAREDIDTYLKESKYIIPPHLNRENPALIEDYFKLEPNGKFDLGQFISGKMSYLQIPETAWPRFQAKMEPDFVQLYTVLRAAEIICAEQNLPAIHPPISIPEQI